MLNHISLNYYNLYQDSVVLGMNLAAYGTVFDFQMRMSRQNRIMKTVNDMIWWSLHVN